MRSAVCPGAQPPCIVLEVNDILRRIPQIDRLLRLPDVEALASGGSRADVVDTLRIVLAATRQDIADGRLSPEEIEERISEAAIVEGLKSALQGTRRSAYRRVVNATGIILHTGLGLAILAPAALEAVNESLRGYSLVEMDVESGERNFRESALVELLTSLTGAEAGTIVNNNAAATLLILAALARGKEVIVSRGQLVEIGGSFRIPDILKESGARLVEVGTTNRTYVEDYRRAIGPETGMLLQVHTSNYEIQGFVHHTSIEELSALGRETGLPVISDLGSGCFVDLGPHGFKPEPLVRDVVRAGADAVCFSGDKLLGGPQAGIIVGRSDLVKRMRSHPLFRAFRLDKVRLAMIEATLRAYRDPDQLPYRIPSLGLLLDSPSEVRKRALAAQELVPARGGLELDLVVSTAQAGSGSLPAQEIPSWALALRIDGASAGDLARSLRLGSPPVFARVQDGAVIFDFRTVLPGEEAEVARAISGLGAGR